MWIYVRDGEDAFNGMVVMTVDPDEEQAAFVLMDGFIDPADVGRLTERFGNVEVHVDDIDVDLDSLDVQLDDLDARLDDLDIDVNIEVGEPKDGDHR